MTGARYKYFYYGSKKIECNGNQYILSRPYYNDIKLLDIKKAFYEENKKMREEGVEWRVEYSTDNIYFEDKEINLRESDIIEVEKKLIKNFISATCNKEARQALYMMWLETKYCDFVIKCNDRQYVAHRVLFAYHSKKLRQMFNENRDDFVTCLELKNSTQVALQKLLRYLYMGVEGAPKINNFTTLKNLYECAQELGVRKVIDYCKRYPYKSFVFEKPQPDFEVIDNEDTDTEEEEEEDKTEKENDVLAVAKEDRQTRFLGSSRDSTNSMLISKRKARELKEDYFSDSKLRPFHALMAIYKMECEKSNDVKRLIWVIQNYICPKIEEFIDDEYDSNHTLIQTHSFIHLTPHVLNLLMRCLQIYKSDPLNKKNYEKKPWKCEVKLWMRMIEWVKARGVKSAYDVKSSLEMGKLEELSSNVLTELKRDGNEAYVNVVFMMQNDVKTISSDSNEDNYENEVF